MKPIKTLFTFLVLALLPIAFIQCGSAQTNLQEMPMQTGQAYYQKWIAGVQGGGAGINLFIPVDELPENIQLEKVFFQKMAAPIKKETDTLWVARFVTNVNRERDIVMSNNPIEEAVNTPQEQGNFPFRLEDTEAGLSYRQDGVLKYSKILNLKEKTSVAYPSAPPKDRGY